MSALCARIAETGCSGFTPDSRETYICEQPCRMTETADGGMVPLWNPEEKTR